MTPDAVPASYVEAGDKQQRQRRSGHAAGRKQADDAPFDGAAEAMDQGADRLGHRSVEQIDADCGSRMHTEQQDQHRRHQRTAAHTGLPDQ